MADDSEVQVGIDLESLDFVKDLNQAVNALQGAIQSAQALGRSFKTAVQESGALVRNMSQLRQQLRDNEQTIKSADQQTAARLKAENLRLRQQITESQKTLDLKQIGVQDNRTQAAARSAAKNAILSDPKLEEAQIRNFAVQAAITAVNTSVDQIAARLADATAKAAERMVRTSQAALEARLNKAQFQTVGDIRNFTGAGLDRSYVQREITDLTRNQRIQARFGQTLDQFASVSPSDLPAALAQAEQDRRREREALAEAERNRKYLLGLQTRSMLATQRAEERALRDERRRNDPTYSARVGSREITFFSRTGITEDEFASRTANFGLRERIDLYKQLVEQQKAAAQGERARALAERAAGRPAFDAVATARRSSEVRRATLDLDGGADLFGFQARIAQNYILFGGVVTAITGAVRAIGDLDDALKRFQAITQTTNTEVAVFREELLKVASTSRFSVRELAEVAITLGQTGLAAADVAKVLPQIAAFASAAGTSLQEAVDVTTSILGAYNMEAGRTSEIVNVLTGALNQTKLSMQQLTLGITYSANVAGDAGISFSELTAVIGGLAQAGVRSGSTIGTGLRQLIQELTAPSDRLREILKALGITMADVDIKANGFTGVLQNLSAKGFGTSEALAALDLRAASAFSAMTGQINTIKRLQESLLLSNTAFEGAAKANESLYATLQRLGNVLVALLDRAFRPAVAASQFLAGALADLLTKTEGLGRIVPIVGSGFAALAVTLVALRIGSIVSGFVGLTAAIGGAATATNALTVAMSRNPIFLAAIITAGIASAITALDLFASKTETATDRLDKLKTVANDLGGRELKLNTSIGNVDQEIERLINRRDKLNADPMLRRTAIIEAQKAFGELGLSINANATNIDGLIEALRRLRTELQNQLPPILGQQALNLQQQVVAKEAEQRNRASSTFDRLASALPDGGSRVRFLGGQNGLQQQVRAAYSRAFGTDIGTVIDALAPGGLSNTDAAGSATPAFRVLLEQLRRLQGERDQRITASNGRTTPEIASLDTRIKLLENLRTELNDAVLRAQGIQGDRVKLDVVKNQERVQGIRGSADFQRLLSQEQDLVGTASARYNAILGNTSLSPEVQRERLAELTKTIQDEATALAQRVAAYRDHLREDVHTSNEVLDSALGEVENSLTALRKGTHTAAKDAKEVADKLEAIFLRRQDERLTSEIDNLLKRAETAQSRVELDRIETQIQALMAQRETIAGRMEFLRAGAPPVVSPELNATIEEAKERTRTQLQGFVDSLSRYKTRLAEEILKLEDKRLDVRQDTINAEIERFERELRDTKTTPERARELLDAINRLLDEATSIARQRADTLAQRDSKVGPSVAIGTAGARDSVAGQIIDALNARGKGDLARYAVNAGQIESGLDPSRRNASGATGLFQFLPGTFAGNGGDLAKIYDVGEQVNAFIAFTEANAARFRAAFGREATDAEKFLLHNQGAGGGVALLKNPNGNVLDVLRPFYRDANTAARAITGNGGSLDQTAGEFAERVKGLLPNIADRYVSGTTGDVREQNRQNAITRAETDAAVRRETVERSAQEIRLRKDRLALQIDEASIQRELSAARKGANDATDPANATGAAARVLERVAQLRDNAVAQLGSDPRYLGSSPEDQAFEIEKLNAQFRAQAEREALENAKQLGDLKRREYERELEILNSLRQQQQIGVEKGTVALGELQATERKIEALERTRDLDGEEAAKRTEILEIEKAIEAIRRSGLGNDDQLIELQSRLNALKKEELTLNERNAQARAVQGRSSEFSNAVDTANRRFLQNRGLMDNTGAWVSEAVRFGETWNDVLNSVGSNLDGFFERFVSGSMSAGEAFSDLARSVIADLLKMASKAVTNELFKLLLGGAGASSGGETGGLGSWISGLFGGSGMAQGGLVRMAAGGPTPNRDSVPALLMPGEFVVRKSAVDAVGRGTLEAINQLNGVTRSQSEGFLPQNDKTGPGGAIVNVWIVSPDQVPPPGPRDIVAAVADDITRGGSIKALVKQVSVGAI